LEKRQLSLVGLPLFSGATRVQRLGVGAAQWAGPSPDAHLWGQHFDELIQEAKLGHLTVELLPAVVHTHLQHLQTHAPHEGKSEAPGLTS
jgi:hypothetical protein